MVVLIASLAGVVVGAAWLAGYYQPLSTDGGGFYSAGVSAGDAADSITIDNSYGTDFRIVRPEAGAEIAFTFPLWNYGKFGVTVVSIGQPFNPTGIVDETRVQETSGGRAMRATDISAQDWVGVTPFALSPGGYAQVRVEFNVLDCATEALVGNLTDAATVPVTIRVLGAERVVNVDLPYALSFESLPHCP